MKKKSIIIIILSIVVVIACFGFVFTKKQKNIAYKQTSQDKAGIRISKRNHANSEKNNQNENDQYSTNEWMLMGYMAYAHDNYVESDHISNTSELVNAVKDDLDNGDLKAEKISNTSYTLTNKYGSVDIDVEKDDVKITGDGVTVNSKSELEAKFADYSDKIKEMTKDISGASSVSSSDTKKDSSHQNNVEEVSFNDEELIVAAFLTGYGDKGNGDPQKELASLNKSFANSRGPISKLNIDDYISGFYNNDGYISIATNLSTSHYVEYKFNNDSDKIAVKYGMAGVFKKGTLSKSNVLKTWMPYKNDIDKAIIQIKFNKNNMRKIQEEMTHQN